jgi:hypothetical protein
MAAFTSEQLVALRAAMAEGVRSVAFPDGRRIEFRDLAEMMQLERKMSAEVESGAQVRPVMRKYFQFVRS